MDSPTGGAVPTRVALLQGRREDQQLTCRDVELCAARSTGNPAAGGALREGEREAGLEELSAEVQVGTWPYFQWEEHTHPPLSFLQLVGPRFPLHTCSKPSGEKLPVGPFALSILHVGTVLAARKSPKSCELESAGKGCVTQIASCQHHLHCWCVFCSL